MDLRVASHPAWFAAMRAHDRRIKMAMERREDAIAAFKRGNLIEADEAYGEAIQCVEDQNHGRLGRPRSISGQEHEEQLLADCLSNRAQCILDMAQGKGILPDGSAFSSQFEEKEHFDYFKRQAFKQAEECAEKACLVWCDDRSLFRLGLARMLTAQAARVEALWVMKEDNNEIMKDAGRCFLKALKARPNTQTQKMLNEVKDWLAQRDVFTLYPEYV